VTWELSKALKILKLHLRLHLRQEKSLALMLYFSFKSRIDWHLYVKILPDGVTLLLRSEPRNLLKCHLSENHGGISWLCHIHCKSEYTLKHCFLLMMVNTTVSVCEKKKISLKQAMTPDFRHAFFKATLSRFHQCMRNLRTSLYKLWSSLRWFWELQNEFNFGVWNLLKAM